MPRFVILEHDHPALHWDFMLEAGEVLRTWRLASPPSEGVETLATASFDHRLLYLDYEGPVSGNRGTVKRWDAGTYQTQTEGPTTLVLQLEGSRIAGRVVLEKQAEGDGWRLRLSL